MPQQRCGDSRPKCECERLDEHWQDIAEDYERIYSLSGGNENTSRDLREVFEDRLSRQMPSQGDSGQSVTDPSLLRQTNLPFDVDAELIVFGKTVPSAVVSVAGRPVKLREMVHSLSEWNYQTKGKCFL